MVSWFFLIISGMAILDTQLRSKPGTSIQSMQLKSGAEKHSQQALFDHFAQSGKGIPSAI